MKSERQLLLKRLFEQMNSDTIYCALRNYSKIAERTGNDIDLVDPTDVRKVERALHKASEQSGYKYIEKKVRNKNVYLKSVKYSLLRSGEAECDVVKLHLVPFVTLVSNSGGTLTRNRRVWFDNLKVRKVIENGVEISVPAENWELLLTLSDLVKRKKRKYIDDLDRIMLSREIDVETRDRLEKGGFRQNLLGLTSDKEKEAEIRGVIEDLRRKIDQGKREPALARILTLMKQASTGLRENRGLLICLSGPDGAGKTTLKKNLGKVLRESLGMEIVEHKTLYPMNRLMKRKNIRLNARIRGLGESNSSEIERDRGSGFAWKTRRLAGLLSILAQYVAGYGEARYQNILGKTVVVDTAVYDAFVKGHRPQFKLIEDVAVERLPRVDAWIVLKASPRAIIKRKPELTEEEIAVYYRRIGEIAALAGSRQIEIRTDEGVENATFQAVKEIIGEMNERIRSRI